MGSTKKYGLFEEKKDVLFSIHYLLFRFRLSHRNQVAEQTVKVVATSSETKHASMFLLSTEHPTMNPHPSSSPLSDHLGSAKPPYSKVSCDGTRNNR